jgi:hypothetical protein
MLPLMYILVLIYLNGFAQIATSICYKEKQVNALWDC